MRCPSCDEPLPDNAPSCRRCGRVLDTGMIARVDAGIPGHRAPTIVESPTPSSEPSPPPVRPSPPPPSLSTAPAAPGVGARRGHTVYMPPEMSMAAQGPAAAPVPAQRKIVGMLITYSWAPEGQIFPVREGRNLIGRGEECDIRVAQDSMMSQVNSHITFRRGFVVGDMVSMSGTYVDGDPIEEQFRRLPNYAQVRTGSTLWTFVAVAPQADE